MLPVVYIRYHQHQEGID